MRSIASGTMFAAAEENVARRSRPASSPRTARSSLSASSSAAKITSAWRATTTSRARRIVTRITATWADLDYAQRRLLEIQTGTTGLTQNHKRRPTD
jgi:hypothetical protein